MHKATNKAFVAAYMFKYMLDDDEDSDLEVEDDEWEEQFWAPNNQHRLFNKFEELRPDCNQDSTNDHT